MEPVNILMEEKKGCSHIRLSATNQMLKESSFSHQGVKRFQFLRWPLSILETYRNRAKDGSPLGNRIMSTRYPLWAQRYWWAVCAILDEHNRFNRPLVLVDLGCERGIMKRFVPVQAEMHWIGLDRNVTNPLLIKADYQETYACDFDKRLPLADGTADIVVCLHVFEHLPRPEFTMSEIKRILRPGGILLTGSPIKPKFAAQIREAQFKRKIAHGHRRYGKHHINAFWPKRWKDLAEHQGLKIEFMSGSHLLRWTGLPLENYRWWLRLNQLWGGLFPSLGMELYLQARNTNGKFNKTTHLTACCSVPPPKIKLHWVAGIAAVIILGLFMLLHARTILDPHECVVEQIAKKYQDGNDHFYVGANQHLEDLHTSKSLSTISDLNTVSKKIGSDRNQSKDSFFLIPHKDLKKLKMTSAWAQLSLIKEVSLEGEQFILLSTEKYPVSIKSKG